MLLDTLIIKKISKNKLNFLRNISFKKLYKEKFDEIFISTFEYNFDVLEDLKILNIISILCMIIKIEVY